MSMSEIYDPGHDKWLRRKTLTAVNDASMRTVIDVGEYGQYNLDEPIQHDGSGTGPSPLQSVLGALCGCEAVTFRRTATEKGFKYDSINFDAAFTIDIRGRLGDRTVRQHFKTVQVRAIVATEESVDDLVALIDETEARCPVMNLLLDSNVDLTITWVRQSSEGLSTVSRLQVDA